MMQNSLRDIEPYSAEPAVSQSYAIDNRQSIMGGGAILQMIMQE